MDIEELRTPLGEELFTQVSERLADVSGLRIISTSNGTWIPKSKFDEERKQVRELQGRIDALTTESEEKLEEVNRAMREKEESHTKRMAEATAAGEETRQKLQAEIDRLTAEATERESELSTMRNDLTTKAGTIAELTKTVEERDGTISSLHREAKERMLIRASGARDEDVVFKLIDQGRVSVAEDGTLSGVQEQLEALKKGSAYLFSKDHPPRGGFAGGKEQPEVKRPATADVNAAIRAAFGH